VEHEKLINLENSTMFEVNDETIDVDQDEENGYATDASVEM
jgi:hypothetical protein